MRKLSKILIILGLLFTGNKSYGMVPVIMFPVTADTPTSPIHEVTYSCGGQIYTYANYENYKRCLENEKVKAERERKQKILDERKEALSQYEDFFEKVGVKLNIHTTEKQYNNWLNKLKEKEERVELKRKKKIFEEREEALSQYEDFFEKIGVNLEIDTSEEEYDQWLNKLKIEEADYIERQEDKQKLEELEKRIRELESQKLEEKKIVPVPEKITQPIKKEAFKPKTVGNNPMKETIIPAEKPPKEIKEEKTLETENTIETQTIINNEPNLNFFKKIIKWFKSLSYQRLD